jgi:hypothetical protein
MLRAFLTRRGGSVCRLQATSSGFSYSTQFFSDSSTLPSYSIARINLYEAKTWVQKIVPSLEVFLEKHKHLMIPTKFVVPYGDTDYPEEAWGYPLGTHCRNLRSLKQSKKKLPFFAVDDLEALNFPWNMRQCKWDVLVLPSLQRHYALNGHSDIPTRFVVPEGDERWPEHLWGFKLGATLTTIKYADTFKAQRESSQHELDNIGFSLLGWRERMWEERILPALQTFSREFGHCNVHFNFVVPDDDKWPEAARRLRLGATVANMRCRGNYEDMADRDEAKLKAISFVWSPEDERWTTKVLPAFERFSEIHGSGWVPVDFVVPYEGTWPEELQGLRLGNIFMKIRHTGAYSSFVERDRERLEEIGVDFEAPYDPVMQKMYG